MEELTNLIYDSLMRNTQHPQIDVGKIEDPYCDAKIGLITFDYEGESFELKLTKHFK